MVLFMSRPTRRSGSRHAQFQRRVPAAVLQVARGKQVAIELPPEKSGDAPLRTTVTLGDAFRFSLRTDDKALRELRHAAAVQQLDRAYRAFLKGPRKLTTKERTALAGVLYNELASRFEDEPLNGHWWKIVREVTEDALSGRTLTIDTFPNEGRLRALDRYVGPFLDAVLLREGVVIDDQSRLELLRSFAGALMDAARKLEKNFDGDYSPDPAAARFPKWERASTADTARPSALAFDDLLARWKRENKRAASSIASFNHHVADFKSFLGHNAVHRVTKTDVVGWKDRLLERGLKAKTINGGYLASINALYNLAKRDDLIDKNPAGDVSVPEKKRAVDPLDKTYTDAEVATILALADRETLSYLRWVPWLTALTGARVSEVVQLWGKHIDEDDGIPFLSIVPTDDGGTLKTNTSNRKVPLHHAIIERGFLDFVRSRPNGGPLFYGEMKAVPRRRKSETAAHASKGPANRVREWIRGHGFTNPLKAPNHAFRYWFKHKCAELDIPDSIADAIQGHSDGSVADRYRGVSLLKKAEAISKIAVPKKSVRLR